MIDSPAWHKQAWVQGSEPECCGQGCCSCEVLLCPESDSSAGLVFPGGRNLPVGYSPHSQLRFECCGWTSASGAWGSASRQSPFFQTQTSYSPSIAVAHGIRGITRQNVWFSASEALPLLSLLPVLAKKETMSAASAVCLISPLLQLCLLLVLTYSTHMISSACSTLLPSLCRSVSLYIRHTQNTKKWGTLTSTWSDSSSKKMNSSYPRRWGAKQTGRRGQTLVEEIL